MKEYLSSCEEVLKEQNSSEQGLSTGEAQQRLSRFGKNELEKGKKTSLLKRFFRGTCRPDDHYPDRGCGNFRNHSFL